MDTFVVENAEVWLKNLNISLGEGQPFQPRAPAPTQLLHREEIRRLIRQDREKGLTLIPTRWLQDGFRSLEGPGREAVDKQAKPSALPNARWSGPAPPKDRE